MILQRVDEWLLMVLKLQPTEIDALDLDDYWRWFEVAQEHVKAQER